MNSWNYNEVTQDDLYEFKACKHNKTGEIYGIKDDAMCQSGKEIDKKELERLSMAANKGDKKARAELEKISKAEADHKKKAKEEEAAAKKKKEEEAGKKGKKGKGGKGKKGGGKGKGGKGAKGGKGKGGEAKAAPRKMSSQERQQAKQAAVKRARETVQRLQKMLKEVSDPKAKQQIQKAIGDLMKSVVDATKADMGQQPGEGAGKLQGTVQGEAKKEES